MIRSGCKKIDVKYILPQIKINSLAAPHKCQVNWTGSSGAMQSALALDLISDMHNTLNKRVHIKAIVSDDFFTMRSHC